MSKKILSPIVCSVFALLSLCYHTASAETFAEKHPRRAEVDRRERNQQKRIANGLKSGKLSAAQASKIEGQEAAIDREKRQDVKANGGYLTKGQQQQINQQQNGVSKEIYNDKHQ